MDIYDLGQFHKTHIKENIKTEEFKIKPDKQQFWEGNFLALDLMVLKKVFLVHDMKICIKECFR